MVFALDSSQRADSVCLTDGFGTHLAHPPMLYFALFHQVGNGRCHLFCRSVRIGTMLVKHRQGFEPQASERFLTITANCCRSAVLTSRSLTVDDFMPEFSRYADPALELGQRFTGQIFIGQRAVDDCRVEECHTTVYRLMQQSDTLFLIRMLAAVIGHTHHAETESRNLEGRLPRSQYAMSFDTGDACIIVS